MYLEKGMRKLLAFTGLVVHARAAAFHGPPATGMRRSKGTVKAVENLPGMFRGMFAPSSGDGFIPAIIDNAPTWDSLAAGLDAISSAEERAFRQVVH